MTASRESPACRAAQSLPNGSRLPKGPVRWTASFRGLARRTVQGLAPVGFKKPSSSAPDGSPSGPSLPEASSLGPLPAPALARTGPIASIPELFPIAFAATPTKRSGDNARNHVLTVAADFPFLISDLTFSASFGNKKRCHWRLYWLVTCTNSIGLTTQFYNRSPCIPTLAVCFRSASLSPFVSRDE